MKVGDLIRVRNDQPLCGSFAEQIGLLVRIGTRHNNRQVGTVLTSYGIETWPLDSYYEYEVINESR